MIFFGGSSAVVTVSICGQWIRKCEIVMAVLQAIVNAVILTWQQPPG